jgi:hypothetical protein
MAEKEVLPRLVRAAELRLGDVVRTSDAAYSDHTVIEIGPMVHLFRVYVSCANFSCSGSQSDRFAKPPVESSSVIDYIGTSTLKITRDDPRVCWNLIQRGDVDAHEERMRKEREEQETLKRRYASLRVHLHTNGGGGLGLTSGGLTHEQIDALADRYDCNGRICE